MSRLIEIIGKELLQRIKTDIPELYSALMDYIRDRKGLITFAFCRDLLAKYNINLEEERRLQRLQNAQQFKGSQNSQLNDSQNDVSANEELNHLNLTNMTDMLNGK